MTGRILRIAGWVALLGACSGAPDLPPVPLVEGPLHLRVAFPLPGALLPAEGSYTVYGSVGNGRAAVTVNGRPARVLPNGSFIAYLPVPDRHTPRYEVVSALGRDTLRTVLPVRLAPAAPGAAPADEAAFAGAGLSARLRPGDEDPANPEHAVIGRPAPGGRFRWFLLPGTRVQVTGARGEFARVRLDSGQEAWVLRSDVGPPEPTPVPVRRVSAPRVASHPEWIDVSLPVSERPPFLVEESRDGFVLTLYGTAPDRTGPAGLQPQADPLVTDVETVAERSDRVRVRVTTSGPPFGYAVRWDGGALVLRVRRPPRVSRDAPLRGITVAVDPGHPPLGAVGPTGLREAEVTLAIGMRLKRMLEERGARVVMTRSSDEAVELDERPRIAAEADAHALVSLHADSSPGEVDPYADIGTRTFFYHPHSAGMASLLQRKLLRALGLKDRGLFIRDLALVRPTWMPSALCEGAMLNVPEHEAALRTPEFQAAYARAVVDGLEAFFRSLP